MREEQRERERTKEDRMTERRKSRKLRRHNQRDKVGRKDIIQTESKIETQKEREMDRGGKGKGQRVKWTDTEREVK